MALNNYEQYLLELINRARLDPLAEAGRYGIDLNEGLSPGTLDGTQKQVLAANELLDLAAEGHSNWMLLTDTFSHTGAGGSTPGDRMVAAGYAFTGAWAWGENISWCGTTGTLDLRAAIERQHEGLFLSAGHRENTLNGYFREIGLAQIEGQFTHTNGVTFNASMITENFATSGSSVFVTGVVFNDTDDDLFYAPGEGVAGATFTVGGTSVTSAASGGYALALAAASSAQVSIVHNALSAVVDVDLTAGNVKLDVVDGSHLLASANLTIVSGITQATLLGVADINLIGSDAGSTLSGNRGNNNIIGGAGADILYGHDGDDLLEGQGGADEIYGGGGGDTVSGGAGADRISLGGGADTVVGTLSELHGDTILDFTTEDVIVFKSSQIDTDEISVVYDAVEGKTTLQLDENGDGLSDGEITLEGDFSHVDFQTAFNDADTSLRFVVPLTPDDKFAGRAQTTSGTAPTDMSQIRDFDGNDLGAGGSWQLIGEADIQFDGDGEFIFINHDIGRWATVGPDAQGAIDFNNHGSGGDTRVVGVYIDPLVEAGTVARFSDHDSQHRFQNDLNIDNLRVVDAFDFDGDGFQEIYFRTVDGTAYLRALMHADGNIQYANYQSAQQVEDYLTGLGYGQDVLDAILV
ncbi:CAP domain-containing protein [Aliiroseovarius sp. PrR006]|uniref:CAP domain-containing protein n=1 Tax=Aliiroseovarius sp. PrR006 TaxID=2706883 RepID=UPI0013D82708|nr:CAP domain-containing protein [Aliiroseovarius sp. PrR006]NDW54604.1 hypothetical protein [Aliiroseovarius sp. PrR006]